MWRVSLLWLVAPLIAQQRPLDLVILVERSPGVELSASPAALGMTATDQIAIVSFDKASRVEQAFTNDAQKITAAINRLNRQAAFVHVRTRLASATPGHHLFHAVLDSIGQFARPEIAGRDRALIAVFATEDVSTVPTIDDVREALLASHIRFFADVVSLRTDCCPLSRVQTPPTLPGRYTSVQTLPPAAIKRIADVASATGGQILESSSLSAVLTQIRSSSQPLREGSVSPMAETKR